MRYHVNGGLELLTMLLAHYAYTGDMKVAQTYLLPLAESQMNFFNNHYQVDLNGHKCYTPAQSIETWQEAINPLPDLAGLHWVLTQLLTLSFISPNQKSNWSYLLGVLPSIPTGSNGTANVLLPAEAWLADSLHNSENPELYAIFPFPLYGVGNPNINIAINSYWNRKFHCQKGWCQDLLDSSLLGLVGESRSNLEQRIDVQLNTGYRFPTFVGPFFDYCPEEDHTSVAQLGVQYMLLQTQGNSILLFPAWPQGWDVHFKLYTAQQTTVEAICKNGKITLLTVTPSSRRSSVQIIGNSCTL
jgi:alpha-L-fucosidase 2